MNKKICILSFILFILFVIQSSVVFSSTNKCSNPELYGLSSDEVNMSNMELYCWEIKYLKQYHNLLSTSLSSYYDFYSKDLSKKNIEILRKLGITPEKYDYLRKYFIDDEILDDTNFENLIKKAIKSAKKDLKEKLEYKYGNPVMTMNSLAQPISNVSEVFKWIGNASIDGVPFIAKLKQPTVYDSFLYVYGELCVPYPEKMNAEINKYPDSLQPVGVIGKYFVNAFGEVSLELNAENQTVFSPYEVRLPGVDKSLGKWNTLLCSVTDFNKTMKSTFSCTTCTMFEIAFNTVSRIGFILYDKLSRYALDLMIVLFSLWSLLMFFEHAIKKQDGFGYIKTFFTKIVWIFVVGAFLSVSITDENNIINYTIRPLTDFMKGYTETVTKALDSTNSNLQCKYTTKDLKDNKYLFSKEVKQNIVCTIERVADFNNMNILIGISEIKQGIKQVINFTNLGSGIAKILLGLTLAGIFFIFNLAVPYFFIESLFNIAVVVFLFPLFLMGYAFDKGKQFVKNGLDTFLSAISQIIALSIISSVISLIMFYISSIDFYGIQSAIENNNSQEVASSMLLFYSFNTNQLLQMIYSGIICRYLLNQALKIANMFGSDKESLPTTFKTFMTSTVKTMTSVVADYSYVKLKSESLVDKIKKNKEKKQEPQNSKVQ